MKELAVTLFQKYLKGIDLRFGAPLGATVGNILCIMNALVQQFHVAGPGSSENTPVVALLAAATVESHISRRLVLLLCYELDVGIPSTLFVHDRSRCWWLGLLRLDRL